MNRRMIRQAVFMLVVTMLSGGCTAAPSCPEPLAAKSSASKTISVLQRRVKEQDKRIAELTTQLEMLKQIDQDRQKDREGKL
jgi:hypothetical protein